jgi:hypothetical protein
LPGVDTLQDNITKRHFVISKLSHLNQLCPKAKRYLKKNRHSVNSKFLRMTCCLATKHAKKKWKSDSLVHGMQKLGRPGWLQLTPNSNYSMRFKT